MFTKTQHVAKRRPIIDKLGVMAWQEDADLDMQLKSAQKMGLKYMRFNLEIAPDYVTGTKNFDPAQFDSALTSALKLDFNLIVNIYSLPWSNWPSNADDPTTHSRFTPDELANFKEICQTLVMRYANQNILWEGFNEANGGFWSNDGNAASTREDTMRAWVDFDKWFGQLVKNHDPTGTYATLSSTGYLNYRDAEGHSTHDMVIYADKFGLFDLNADLVSFHPYIMQAVNGGRPEILLRDSLMRDMPPSAQGKPIISTEFGFSRSEYGDETYKWQGYWDWESAANLTVREILVQDLLDFPIISLYALKAGKNYSILNQDCTPNLVGQAVANLIGTLSGYTLAERIQVSKDSELMNEVYCLRYSKPDEVDILVYWTPVFYPQNFEVNIAGKTITLKGLPAVQYLKLI